MKTAIVPRILSGALGALVLTTGVLPDALAQPPIRLSQATVVMVPNPQPMAGFMTGEWVGAPCQMIFQIDDGAHVQGDCATPAGLHHVFRGVYTAPDRIDGTVTRIDPSGCQVTNPISFHISDQNTVDYSLPGWFGCGMNGGGAANHWPVTRAQAVAAYVPNPFDAYLVGIVPTDVVFLNGSTYVWTTDSNGNRTQQLYAQGDHRQELLNRSAQVRRTAAQNGGQLPSAAAKPNLASSVQPSTRAIAPNFAPKPVAAPIPHIAPPTNHPPVMPPKAPVKLPVKMPAKSPG
jgi:hypothetical protein